MLRLIFYVLVLTLVPFSLVSGWVGENSLLPQRGVPSGAFLRDILNLRKRDDNSGAFGSENVCHLGAGIYPLRDCRIFAQCDASGRQTTQRCPPNTLFNEKLSVCDHSYNVDGCENGIRRYSLAVAGPKNVILLRDPLGIRSRSGRRCTEGTALPHPYDCSKYEICFQGAFRVQACKDGESFDSETRSCQPRRNVRCGARSSDVHDLSCHPRFDYISPHPDTCQRYTECKDGKLVVRDCGPGRAYNPDIKGCDDDYQNIVSLCNRASSRRHSDNSVSSGSVRPQETNPVCSDGTDFIAAHPEFCNKFVECENGILFTKDCGPGTVYNRYTGVCDWKENTREAIPGSCGAYLECQRGIYRKISCEDDNSRVRNCPREYACYSGAKKGSSTSPTIAVKTTTQVTETTTYPTPTTTEYTTRSSTKYSTRSTTEYITTSTSEYTTRPTTEYTTTKKAKPTEGAVVTAETVDFPDYEESIQSR